MAMSEETRLKLSRLAKERAAIRKAALEQQQEPVVHPDVEAPTVSNGPDYGDVMKLVAEMKAELDALKAEKTARLDVATEQPKVSASGKLVGMFEKFSTNPKDYPDPTAKLALDPKLARFAFGINYELTWKITSVFYETVDGVKTKEPRFIVELNRVMLDEDTGVDTGGRYTIRAFMFHEDPEASLVVAREQNLNVDDYGGEREFLDEMRYHRIRNWLLEAFYPPKRDADKQAKKEMVVGGKIVQYFEVSGTETGKIPFGELGNKL